MKDTRKFKIAKIKIILFNIKKINETQAVALLLLFQHVSASGFGVFCLILSISYVVIVLRSKVHIDIIKNRKISRNLNTPQFYLLLKIAKFYTREIWLLIFRELNTREI